MEKINKPTLARKVSEKTGLTKKQCLVVINILFDIIIDEVENDNEVDISCFGKFFMKERNSSNKYNPRTLQKVEAKTSKTMRFKPSKLLKKVIKK